MLDKLILQIACQVHTNQIQQGRRCESWRSQIVYMNILKETCQQQKWSLKQSDIFDTWTKICEKSSFQHSFLKRERTYVNTIWKLATKGLYTCSSLAGISGLAEAYRLNERFLICFYTRTASNCSRAVCSCTNCSFSSNLRCRWWYRVILMRSNVSYGPARRVISTVSVYM